MKRIVDGLIEEEHFHIETRKSDTVACCLVCRESFNNETSLLHHLVQRYHRESVVTITTERAWPFCDGKLFTEAMLCKNKDGEVKVDEAIVTTEVPDKVPSLEVPHKLGILEVPDEGKIYNVNDDEGRHIFNANFVGYTQIDGRCYNGHNYKEIRRIWATWGGVGVDTMQIRFKVGVIVMKYNHNLGKKVAVREDGLSPIDDFETGSNDVLWERCCTLCNIKLIPNTDVATLFRVDTRCFYCDIPDEEVFHVYHVSCLIKWIMACRYWMISKPSGLVLGHIPCPGCVSVEDGIASPNEYLKKLWSVIENDPLKDWGSHPEPLEQCSIGYCFSWEGESLQEVVEPLLVVPFYQHFAMGATRKSSPSHSWLRKMTRNSQLWLPNMTRTMTMSSELVLRTVTD